MFEPRTDAKVWGRRLILLGQIRFILHLFPRGIHQRRWRTGAEINTCSASTMWNLADLISPQKALLNALEHPSSLILHYFCCIYWNCWALFNCTFMSLVVMRLRVCQVKHFVSKSFAIKCSIFNLKETSPALALQLEPTYSCTALGSQSVRDPVRQSRRRFDVYWTKVCFQYVYFRVNECPING